MSICPYVRPDVWIFNFGSVSVRFLKKNSDSVRNEFGSVRFAKTRFGSDIDVG